MANFLNLFIDFPDLSLATKTPKEPELETYENGCMKIFIKKQENDG